MLHYNEFMENKIVLQSTFEEVRNKNRNENNIFYRYKVEFNLQPNELLLESNQSEYYYDYYIPDMIDKIDDIEIEGVEHAELFLNGLYSCQVDNDLEIVPCVTYSVFSIRFYFSVPNPAITLRYNAYLFPYQFKYNISNIPFHTDTHIYTDGVVELK